MLLSFDIIYYDITAKAEIKTQQREFRPQHDPGCDADDQPLQLTDLRVLNDGLGCRVKAVHDQRQTKLFDRSAHLKSVTAINRRRDNRDYEEYFFIREQVYGF